MSKFIVGSFWKRRDGLKAEILANDLSCGNPILCAVYSGSNKYYCALSGDGCVLDDDQQCVHDNDLIGPWVEKKTVTLKKWLMKIYFKDKDELIYFITNFQSSPSPLGEVVREYDTIEVEL